MWGDLMEKKSLFLIIVCIVVFSFVALTYVGIIDLGESVQVGDVKFKLPEGYKNMGVNKHGYQTASNGLDSLYFDSYGDKNVSKYIKECKNDCISKNKTFKISNFTTNGINVYKLVDSQNATHYWFKYGDKTYTIFTWKEVFRADDIVKNMISSSIAKR